MSKILGLSILVLVLFILAPTIKAVTVQPAKISPTKASVENKLSEVNYTLPYPGILPDHPLYFVKLLRDQILELLIVDKLRKLEFFVLVADKHVAMVAELVQKENMDLAGTILVRGVDYFAKALTTGKAYQETGTALPGHIKEKMRFASQKYIEVLTHIKIREDSALDKRVKSEVERIQQLQLEVGSLR